MTTSTAHMDMNSAVTSLGQIDAQYMYAHAGYSYAETSTSSETTSPVMASVRTALRGVTPEVYRKISFVLVSYKYFSLQFDLSIISEFNPVSSHIYPSPVSSRETASPRPAIKVEDIQNDSLTPTKSDPSSKVSKSAPKRKRENRYKNAPPSVLSVGSPLHFSPRVGGSNI